MESDSQAPPAPREDAQACSDAASLEACSLSGGAAFRALALALPSADEPEAEASNGHCEVGLSEAEVSNGHAELGLSEAMQLACAASLRHGCVIGEERDDAHLDNAGDVVRRALLLDVRGASSGGASLQPGCVTVVEGESDAHLDVVRHALLLEVCCTSSDTASGCTSTRATQTSDAVSCRVVDDAPRPRVCHLLAGRSGF